MASLLSQRHANISALFLLAMACNFESALASADDVTKFKDIELGEAIQAVQTRHPFFECMPSKPGQQMCYPWRKASDCTDNRRRQISGCRPPADLYQYVGGIPIKIWLIVVDGKIVSIDVTFVRQFYSQLSAAMSAKYGSPSSSPITKKFNAAGAVFDSQEQVWLREDARIRMEEYGAKTGEGRITYTLKTYLDTLPDRQKQDAQSTAKDL